MGKIEDKMNEITTADGELTTEDAIIMAMRNIVRRYHFREMSDALLETIRAQIAEECPLAENINVERVPLEGAVAINYYLGGVEFNVKLPFPVCKCLRCSYEWESQGPTPKACPRCKSYKWNVAKKVKT